MIRISINLPCPNCKAINDFLFDSLAVITTKESQTYMVKTCGTCGWQITTFVNVSIPRIEADERPKPIVGHIEEKYP